MKSSIRENKSKHKGGMALVTLQRSPSVAGSQCSNSDTEAEDDEGRTNDKRECFITSNATALVLALKDIPQHAERRLSTDSTKSTNSTQSNNSDIQLHLQSMFALLSPEETLKMAVKLESQRSNKTRYLVIATRRCSRNSTTDRRSKITRNNSSRTHSSATGTGAQAATNNNTQQQQQQQQQLQSQATIVDNNSNKPQQSQQQQQSQQLLQQSQTGANDNMEVNEKRLSSLSTCSNRQSFKCDPDKNSASGDSIGCSEGNEESCLLGIDCNERTTIGLVVPILADTTIHLDGDGGFSVTVCGKTHIFKPVSVQAMWSALQTLHKVSQKARENNFYPGGPSHDWITFYENRIESDQSCLNEWNAMDSLESRRPPSPDAIRNKPTAKEETESVIKMKLKEIMMSVDLDEVTSKYIRGRLEEMLDMDLGEYKSFIDEEMLIILGQMDAPTEIFEHVYLGSEWNASNLEELQKNGVRHILNVTREIDNFFPGIFDYFNVRVYDDDKTNLLKHWDNTFRYITRAKSEGSKVLVHCKMGVSRSASVVIAYAMKAYNWDFKKALDHVKGRRSCIKPNKNFLNQLETYRGMLDAMKNKEKLQRSKSETNLKSTKDARLLPGSEPTPLIQALNQSKSKSTGHGVSGDGVGSRVDESSSIVVTMKNNVGDLKQRKIIRRSSSTSPKSIQSETTIVMRQQSQSMEYLTPERNDEPKNMRFPGSNGENYSVTQNQVLHIQKNTPPPPPPPPPPPSKPHTSVRTRVLDLETSRVDVRKTVDDRKSLSLLFGRSFSQDGSGPAGIISGGEDPLSALADYGSSNVLGSPAWTGSAKLITQTSTIPTKHNVTTPRSRRNTTGSNCNSDTGDIFSSQVDNVFAREEETRHSRKTHSWAATSGGSGGGIIMETPIAKLGSNSSIDSASSNATTTTTPAVYEGYVRTRLRPRQRELPSRHASWGSGDSRSGAPMRNSSWGSYDTNRNTFQYRNTAAAAIFEGQIHELNKSNKTATHHIAANEDDNPQHYLHHSSSVKRTTQKLEECTALKKLCQENGEGEGEVVAVAEGEIEREGGTSIEANPCTADAALACTSPQKRSSNLYRSSSAAGSMRARYPNRCNSEEFVFGTSGGMGLPRYVKARRSDGSKPLHSELFSASAPETYSMSDIENKNTLPQEILEDSETVELRRTQQSSLGLRSATEEQRISGNVQSLKKSFEAKAGVTGGALQTQPATGSTAKKGQSLPSSPVAQHLDHSANMTSGVTAHINTVTSMTAAATTTTTITGAPSTTSSSNLDQPTTLQGSAFSTTSSSSSSSSSSSVSSSSGVCEGSDRNVKGLVHKYQTTTTTTTSATVAPVTATTVATFSNIRPRPRSYYENPLSQHSQRTFGVTGKPHNYNDGRPPPAPAKSSTSSSTTSTSYANANIITTIAPASASAPAPVSATANTTTTPMTENIIQQQQQQQHQHPHQHQQQQRRLQQHGKTHPLAKLSVSKPSLNAAAYNTM